MRLRLAAILLALLAFIGTPQSAMARTVCREKTASSVFPANAHPHARPEPLQVLDRVPETTPCDYEPASGRPKWLSRDPIGERGGLNLYRGVKNNSVNYLDKFGLATQEPPGNGRVCNKCCKDIAVLIDSKYYRLRPGECTDPKEPYNYSDVDGAWVGDQFFSVGDGGNAFTTWNACEDEKHKHLVFPPGSLFPKRVPYTPRDRGAPDNEYNPLVEGEELMLYKDHGPSQFYAPWDINGPSPQ